jgi:protein O-mannosyl-transferase
LSKKKNTATAEIKVEQPGGLKSFIWFISVLLITAMVYSGVSKLDFQMQWDDHEQVVLNSTIKKLSGENIQKMFSGYVIGMYQPLTSLSFAVDYQIGELNAGRYHSTNLLLHLLNTFLVGLLGLRLFKRNDAAAALAILFGLHPMQVETVCWISTRSTLLFTAFFLVGLLFYEHYLRLQNKSSYALAFLMMLLASLSKSMAVTFPLALLAIDYLYNRKNLIKLGLEKIPFFAMSIIFGIVAISYTDTSDIELDVVASPFERVIFAFYSIHFYLIKLLLPTGLSAAHYFPAQGQIPVWYYLAPLTLVIAALPGVFIKEIRRPYFFGLLFFAATIALVVLVPGRRTIVAERYAYLPYVGLIFSTITFAMHLLKVHTEKKVWNLKLIGVIALLAISSGSLTASRKQIWKDSGTLFSDVITKYPDNYHGYAARALHFLSLKKSEEAMLDFNRALELKDDFHEGHYNRGIIYSNYKNEHAKAIPHYSRAIELKPDNASYRVARATALSRIKKFDEAAADFNEAIRLEPANARAFENRGVLKADQGLWTEAIIDYTKSIELDAKNANTYVSRGAAYSFLEKHNEAIADYKMAVTLDPKNAQAYYNMGVSEFKLERFDQACSAWGRAASLGNTAADGLVKQYCSRNSG